MHLAVKNQANAQRLFITQPWAIAFKHLSDEAYVVSAASNIVVKIGVNAVDGTVAVQSDPADATRVLQIPLGKNPRGIVVNAVDSRAYVMNYVSRNVAVIDLTASVENVFAVLPAARLPVAGTLEDKVQIGCGK